MAIGKDIIRRVLVEFDADESDLERAFQNIQDETKETSRDFADMGAKSAKALDMIGLHAEGQVGKVGKLHSAFQGLTGGINKGLGAIDNMAKSMAPWNQAFELGGKAVQFADSALDAYIKKFPDAKKEVDSLRSSLRGLKEDAMAYAGATLTRSGIEEGRGFVFDAFNTVTFGQGSRSLENRKTREANASQKLVDFSGITSQMDEFGNFVEVSTKALDEWAVSASGIQNLALERTFDKIGASLDNMTKKAGGSGKARASKFGDFASLGGTDAGSIGLGSSKFADALGAANPMGQQYQAELEGVLKAMEDARTKALTESWMSESAGTNARRAGYLESAFGPIEQFDVYKQGFEALGAAFDVFGNAVGASYRAIVTGQGGVGAAFKKMAADGMLAAGTASMVDGARELALGFGSLALGPLGGVSAAAHFKSAAMHAAVAAGAGLAARGLGAGSTPSAAKPGAGEQAGGGGSSGGGGGGGSSGDRALAPIVVVVGDQFGMLSNRQQSLYAQEAVDRAVRERDD
jgi:hypothetical protein